MIVQLNMQIEQRHPSRKSMLREANTVNLEEKDKNKNKYRVANPKVLMCKLCDVN